MTETSSSIDSELVASQPRERLTAILGRYMEVRWKQAGTDSRVVVQLLLRAWIPKAPWLMVGTVG